MSPLKMMIEAAGYPCQSYSGRGMGGRACLGAVIDDMGVFIADVMGACLQEAAHPEMQLVADEFRCMRTDRMGTETIVYFPRVRP